MNEKNTVAPATCGCRKAKNDIILILALLAIVAAVGAFVLLFRSEGEAVVVSVDGVQYGEYSLFEDRSVEIRIGDNLNYLIIKEGKAYMEQASCPDGICVSHRPVSREGESIVCLPNKVVVTVKNGGNDSTDTVG